MEALERQTDTTTLLALLRENHALFESIVARVSPQRMADGEWSGKDVAAHTTAWTRRLIAWLDAAARGEEPAIPDVGATWRDLDRLNAATYPGDHARPVADILADARQTFEALLTRIASLSHEQLFDPGYYSWMRGAPLVRRITGGPGYGHLQGHLYDLLRLLDPAQLATPDAAALARCVGTYTDADGRTVTITMERETLLFSASWERDPAKQECPCIALDGARYAYEDGGLLTFTPADQTPASAVEVWAVIYRRGE